MGIDLLIPDINGLDINKSLSVYLTVHLWIKKLITQWNNFIREYHKLAMWPWVAGIRVPRLYIAVMHDSGTVLIPIPGLLWKTDSNSNSDSRLTLKAWFQDFCKCLIPILIPVKSGIIPESIPIPESELCITAT